MKTNSQKIVMAALFAALCCVVTMIIKIPSPLQGYINIGDSVVLLSGWLLSPTYGFFAAGIGSALADVFSGYVIYAPVTFLIKGLMAVIAHVVFRILHKLMNKVAARVVSGILAELIMVLGYFLFDGIMYGWVPSLAIIPGSIVQAVVGLILGVVLIKTERISSILKKTC